jgi:hypothetical protein
MFLDYNNADNLSKMIATVLPTASYPKVNPSARALRSRSECLYESRMSKGLNNGFCNLLSQRPNFLLRVSSDRQCLRWPIARILCRLTVRFGADREAAWGSEGLRAAFADLMTKKPTWECEKTSVKPERCRKTAWSAARAKEQVGRQRFSWQSAGRSR